MIRRRLLPFELTFPLCRMQLLVEEVLEGQGKEIRGGDTEIGEVQGEAITYNDYFNDSSDEGSYVESEGEPKQTFANNIKLFNKL